MKKIPDLSGRVFSVEPQRVQGREKVHTCVCVVVDGEPIDEEGHEFVLSPDAALQLAVALIELARRSSDTYEG